MAGAVGTPPQPLRLKDLLELDCDSCSAAGFRCYPRRLGDSSAPAMRRLLLDSPASLRRHHPSKLSSLSRTLSRRFVVFWRRRDEIGEDDAAAAAPSGSESGASSSTSDDSSRRRGSRCESDSDFSTATSSASDSMVVTANGDEHEATMKRKSSSGTEADDKEAEQLSPVAVMDFPSDDDDDDAGTCSPPTPSFSLARLQRTKMLRTTQHKIRRFGSTQELGPVNLEALLAATSAADDVPEQQVTQRSAKYEARRPPSKSHRGAGFGHDEPDAEHSILALLIMDAGEDHVAKRLLLDFFVEMKRRRRSIVMEHWGELSAPAGLLLPREAGRLGDGGDVLAAARGWLDGAGSERWGLNDVLRGGEAVVAEMERDRRWMQVAEEQREVGTVVAGMLADQLVDEVVCMAILGMGCSRPKTQILLAQS